MFKKTIKLVLIFAVIFIVFFVCMGVLANYQQAAKDKQIKNQEHGRNGIYLGMERPEIIMSSACSFRDLVGSLVCSDFNLHGLNVFFEIGFAPEKVTRDNHDNWVVSGGADIINIRVPASIYQKTYQDLIARYGMPTAVIAPSYHAHSFDGGHAQLAVREAEKEEELTTYSLTFRGDYYLNKQKIAIQNFATLE